MVTLNIAREINYLSSSDRTDILKSGTVNVNGRSYSVQSCASEGVIRLKRTDLAHASFLTRFISSVREFFTGEKKQLEYSLNVMKQHSVNIDKVHAKIAELGSPAGTGSQLLSNKIEDLAKRMEALNDSQMMDLKFKSAQFADLIDAYSECYPLAIKMDKAMSEPALENKAALTEKTLSELKDYRLNIKNEFASDCDKVIKGELTPQSLAKELGQLNQRSDCYASFVNILNEVSNAVDGYYTDNLEVMGYADGQIHPDVMKSGPLGQADPGKDSNNRILLHNESLEEKKNPVEKTFSICAQGKENTIKKLNEEIMRVLSDLKNGKDVSVSNIIDIRNNFAIAKDYIESKISGADSGRMETVIKRIIDIFNDYGLESQILKFSGMGDELFDTFQKAKSDVILGLRDGNVEQIKNGIDICDKMKSLLEEKFSAAEKLDTQLTESKKLIDDCLNYILQGSKKGSHIYNIGFNELRVNLKRQGTDPRPEQKIALNADEQKIIYDFLGYFEKVTTFLNQKKLTELKRKASSESIVELNEALIQESKELNEAFENVKKIVNDRIKYSILNTKHDIVPNEWQWRASKLEEISNTIFETKQILTEVWKQQKIRGVRISEMHEKSEKNKAYAAKFKREASK